MKRTKKDISFIALFLSVFFSLANKPLYAQVFDEGSIAVNVGIGVISTTQYYSGAGVSKTPVLSLSGEYGIMKLGPGVIGGGLAFAYQSASYTENYGSYYYKYHWTSTLFGFRGTYHPDFLQGEKYELYGIVQLSFTFYGNSFTTNDAYLNTSQYSDQSLSTAFHPYLMVGARYYFTKSFGVYSEFGYDISLIKLGITLKFNKANKK